LYAIFAGKAKGTAKSNVNKEILKLLVPLMFLTLPEAKRRNASAPHTTFPGPDVGAP